MDNTIHSVPPSCKTVNIITNSTFIDREYSFYIYMYIYLFVTLCYFCYTVTEYLIIYLLYPIASITVVLVMYN